MATRNSDIVARLTLNAETFSAAHGEAFAKFAAAAQKAGTDAKASLTSAFVEIGNRAREALDMSDLDGSLNLNVSSLRTQAEAAQKQAVALREVADAAERAARAEQGASSEAFAYAQASAILADRAEENASSLQRQAVALDRIQAELGETSLATIRHGNAAKDATASLNAQRAGAQQLGAQFQDLGVQISMAAGSSNVLAGVMSALAMQGPQVVSAISLMRGSAGGLIGFLSGPWGAAFMAATSVAAILGTQLLTTGDDADTAAGKIDRLKQAIDALNESRANVGQIGEVEKKLNDLRDQRLSLTPRRARGESRESYSRRSAAATASLDAQIRELETLVKLNDAADKARSDANDYRARQSAARTTRTRASGSTGKTDAERLAEKQEDAEKRLRESLDETIQRQRESDQLVQMRVDKLYREADIQEALFELQRQFPGLEGVTNKERAKALGLTEEQVAADRERYELLKAMKVAAINKDYDAKAEQKRLDDEKKAVDELNRQREEATAQQRRSMEDLSRYYFSLFSGRAGDIWRDFKNEGLEVISVLAAQWSIAMITGQKFDPASALGGASGIGGYGGPASTLLSAVLGGRGNSIAEAAAAEGGSAEQIASAAGLTKGLENMSGKLSGLNKYLAGVGAGQAVSGLAGAIGIKQNGTGSALGSAAGAAIGSVIPGVGTVIGGIVGGLAGGTLGALLSPSRSAGATITGVDSVSIGGKDKANYGVASDLSASVISGLQDIADQLGGTVGTFQTTIGVRDGDYRVNTDGTSLKIKNGAVEFDDDAQGAIAYAIADAVADGAIQGLSAASQRILTSGAADDLSDAIVKATLIESIPDRLKSYLDPVGYAIDQLNESWADTWAALEEGAATAEQMAEAQQLYNLELEQVKASTASAAQSLKDFLDAMNAGSSSPLSLRDQEQAAYADLAPFLSQITTGQSIDQAAYLDAAQTWLDIERQLYGSTAQYFDAFDKIQAATSEAIASIENVSSISTASDASNASTAAATTSMAADTQNMVTLLQQQNELLQQQVALLTASLNGSDYIGTGRNYI